MRAPVIVERKDAGRPGVGVHQQKAVGVPDELLLTLQVPLGNFDELVQGQPPLDLVGFPALSSVFRIAKNLRHCKDIRAHEVDPLRRLATD